MNRNMEAILGACIQQAADAHGIAKLTDIGNLLRDRGVDYKALGWPKLSMALQEYPDTISLWLDSSFSPPVAFARWIGPALGDNAAGDEFAQATTDNGSRKESAHGASDGVPCEEPGQDATEDATRGDAKPAAADGALRDVSAHGTESAARSGGTADGTEGPAAQVVSPERKPVPARKAGGPLAAHPGNELTRWAYLVHIPTMLADLSRIALPEVWNVPGSADEDSAILLSYLKYTFVRLRREGKVCEDVEHGIAAFHTGLVDHRYEPIYAVFEPNHSQNFVQKWKLNGFCIAGEDAAGKRLVAAFNPLPEPAVYFRSLHDMFYDIGAPEPIMDYEHILLENVDRLPKSYLLEYCTSDSELAAFIRSTPYERGLSADQYHAELATRIRADLRYYRRLIGRFKEAVAIALKRVRWNYKTAIPMYYPVRNIMSLLLPLSLVEDDQADVALVVERLENGNYLGHTILTLQMAYNNARLVCRLESDWLRVDAGHFGSWPEL